MKHKNLLLALPFAFFVFAGISLSSCKDTPVRKLYKSDIDWKLTWQDEFDKDGAPDPEKWVFSPWHPFCRDNNFVTFVKDGTEKTLFKLIVQGDLTGTGTLTSRDILAFVNYLLGKANLDDASLQAANINEDDEANTIDLFLMYKMLQK